MSATAGRSGPVRGLGPVAAVALVVGNIIGAGIYVVPGSLAAIAGPLSLVAWVINLAGYFCLAAVFADLGAAYPISGGAQVYVRRAFGDLAGFESAYLYWLSSMIGNAAYPTAFVGYLAVLVPSVSAPLPAFLVAQALLWSLTLVNVAGVRVGGAVQVLTAILKVLPLAVVSVALLASGSPSNLAPFAPHGWGALFPAISLVSWLLMGTETVTIPAEEIEGAGRTIRRSAYVGFGIVAVLYLVFNFAVAFGVPATEIASSSAPIAFAAERVLGPTGGTLVALGAMVSAAGVLNGWILVTGRLPYAAARDGLAPGRLARIDPRTGTPVAAIALSSVPPALLLLLYFDRSLIEAYNLMALTSTAMALLVLGGACAAEVMLLRREPEAFAAAQRRRGPYRALAGLAFVAVMLAGVGGMPALLTLLAAGGLAPCYLRFRKQPRR
ncbi:MAG TPA: APC family permease [Vicinamibacteria bacterium]|nr:APC family permease [Vicinamibacteria bacterium]